MVIQLDGFTARSYCLYSSYMLLYVLQHENLGELKRTLKETQLEDSKKRELSSALHGYFKDWLYGNVLQFLLFLPKDDKLFVHSLLLVCELVRLASSCKAIV